MENTYLKQIVCPERPGAMSGTAFRLFAACMVAVLSFAMNLYAQDSIMISDDPMETMVKAAPPNIMFVIDNSGSMDWEYITDDYDGKFEGDVEYLFEMTDSRANHSDWDGTVLKDEWGSNNRLKWEAQWAGHNRIFYNPTVTYKPWPTLSDASTTEPRSDPMAETPTLNLGSKYTSLGDITINNGHYYVLDDEDEDGEVDAGESIYLVNFYPSATDKRKYFLVENVDFDGKITGTLTEKDETTLPDRVRATIYNDSGEKTYRSDENDLQNFANWFSYYRRREYTSTAAIGNVISGVEGVRVGFYSINPGCRTDVLPVKVGTEDDTAELLKMLYDGIDAEDGGTPLRSALEEVGKYYDMRDASDGGIGDAPWESEDDGGGCQQSFAIVMTDGYYASGDVPDVNNQDGDQGAPYADYYSNTLADVAMKYYKNDLCPDLVDEVATNSCDDNDAQHMVTYSVAFGVRGTLNVTDADGDGVEDDPCFLSAETPDPVWPNPLDSKEKRIDDLWHAAVNGRGQFFSAGNPEELISSLEDVFENIASRMASGASVAVNGEEVGTDTILYQAMYSSDTWTGDVQAFQVNPITGEIMKEESDILWKATSGSKTADGLENVEWDERRIVTYDGTSDGKPFLFDSLTADQKAALDSSYETDDTDARNLVEYIRGKEIEGFRSRTSKLGDIVHSAPRLAGNTLFVGANDGMLHAFNAETGFERFAYVPNLVFGNLGNLAETDFSHLFYVDMTPYVRSRVSGKTLLVGGLGKGGKGYYCLDVTNADSITAISDEDDVDDMVLWEYPKSGVADDDMGYSFSVAYLVRTNLKDSPWVAIFGNGYDSVNGNAVLYVLDALTGSVIRKIDTASGSSNGLSTPSIIDVNNDNLADYVYAGDLEGNLWKFDLTGEDASKWDVAFKSGGTAKPLFAASGPSGSVQSITSRPDVMRHPDHHGYLVIFGTGRYLSSVDRLDVSQQSVYGIWDYGDDADDSEYLGGITDRDTGMLAYPSGITLQKQEVIDVDNSCGDDYRTLTDNEVQWEGTDEDGNTIELKDDDDLGQNPNPVISAGWFFDFPNTGDNKGERVIKDVAIRDDRAIVISFIPNLSLCSGGGDSWFYIVDAATGGRTKDAQMDINGDGEVTDLVDADGDGTIDESEAAGADVCEPDDEDEETLPPTGRKGSGMWHDPDYTSVDEDTDRADISTSAGTIETLNLKGERLGVYYWRER